ncbi:hypothetical protein GPZ77_33300 [Streptomyces sp. QHH-9511]|uniref:hypothetical protein n=1 Tax=Streptomyces sp. QHH-9511 TaxID=2684468 RepID=UPI0013182E71|nr:hypothetical protein [Streptomyces sp. QHH-9511]QGZ52542.1 hypothetical protein GPZ77_33300 [Streptomyces sp. QHH-9511]
MTTFKPHRRAPLRQRRTRRTPRNIPDRLFDQVFAALRSNRDRALLAFFISTGARASELVGVTNERLNTGQQLIGVIPAVFATGTGLTSGPSPADRWCS